MSKSDATPATSSGPIQICLERIVPDELDHERTARRRLGEQMVATRGGRLKADEVAEVMRMAVPATKKWAAGTVLRCRFLEGSPKVKKKVEAIAHEWERHA